MKRITPEQVVEAYRKTGLKPVRERWVAWSGGECVVCGLSAVAIAAGNEAKEIEQRTIKTRCIGEMLGLPIEYVGGFADGFDDESVSESRLRDSEEFIAGHADGIAAREAVLAAGMEFAK